MRPGENFLLSAVRESSDWNCFNPFLPTVAFSQHMLSERLTSLGIMGEPRVPPLNPSETIVLSEHYGGQNFQPPFQLRLGGQKLVNNHPVARWWPSRRATSPACSAPSCRTPQTPSCPSSTRPRAALPPAWPRSSASRVSFRFLDLGCLIFYNRKWNIFVLQSVLL